jgi:hypothetical protein
MRTNDTAVAPKLVGTWTLLSFELHFDDGTIVKPWGDNVCGQTIYSADGFMAGSFMRNDRPSFASHDVMGGTLEEFAAAMTSVIGYAGPYEYDAATRTVTHHAHVSVFPNWTGTDIQRNVAMSSDGQLLTLSTPPIDYSGRHASAVLVWRRAESRHG